MNLPAEPSALTPEGDLPHLPATSGSSCSRPRRPDHATLVAHLAGASRAELRAEQRRGLGDPYGYDDPEAGDFAHFRGSR